MKCDFCEKNVGNINYEVGGIVDCGKCRLDDPLYCKGNLEALYKKLHKCRMLDPEKSHRLADEALLMYIGETSVTRRFERLTRWYA